MALGPPRPGDISPGTQNALRRYFTIDTGQAGSGPSEPYAQPAIASVPEVETTPAHTYKVLQHPEVQLQCNPREVPNRVKLRKRQLWGPLSFELAADWDRRLRQFRCGCSCQDRYFGGNLWLNLSQRLLHYRRHVMVASGASLACTAQCSYADLLRGGGVAKLKPLLGVRYEFGQGRASLGAHSVHLRQHVPVTPHLGLEICGSMQLPEPAAEINFTEHQQTSASLNGPFRLHIEEANVVIRL